MAVARAPGVAAVAFAAARLVFAAAAYSDFLVARAAWRVRAAAAEALSAARPWGVFRVPALTCPETTRRAAAWPRLATWVGVFRLAPPWHLLPGWKPLRPPTVPFPQLSEPVTAPMTAETIPP